MNKPGKVGLVPDAASKVNGKCLIDIILTGTDWLISLFNILIKFRVNMIAFTADIREMFHRVSSRYPEASNFIITNHYIDDYIHGTQTEDNAIKLIREVIFIHEEGGFELRNFSSNSMEVFKTITEHLVAEDMFIAMGVNNGQRELGIIWKAKTGELVFSLNFSKIDTTIITC